MLDGELLGPDESRRLIKNRMVGLGITNARGLEEEKPSIFKVKPGEIILSMAMGGALTAIFTDKIDPLEGVARMDKYTVCASTTARKVPSVNEACITAGFAAPTPNGV